MHILICDDDAAFGTRMAEYVAAYFAARSILVQTAVCTSAGQALETPELELYQLAFLDVDMPGVNGMVLGRQLKQKCPGLKLVYVSAYLEFALEGYTVNAYRYLLKRDIVHTLPSCLDDLLAELTDQRKTLTVHHNRAATEIPLDQIYYLESDLRQINVYGDIARQPNDFMEQLEKMLTFLLPLYAEEGKSALVIAIGCTGGHHRSVAVAHELAEYITEEGYQVTENHRDISR